MTGLVPETDDIIEIATIVTDKDLKVLAEGPAIAVHQSEPALARMDEWNQRQHGSSGLAARVRASQISVAAARTAYPGFPGQLGSSRRLADVRQQHLPGSPFPCTSHATA